MSGLSGNKIFMHNIPYVISRGIRDRKMDSRLRKNLKKTKSAKGEGKDRLDMVRTISFTLFALQRSVRGWME
jgi:hypothetical protein